MLYLIDALSFSQPEAMKLYGKFTSLIYLSPLLGGYIADRWWGKRKAIIAGSILISNSILYRLALLITQKPALKPQPLSFHCRDIR
jgi:dipeptide/tripeptide permease